MKLCSMNKTYLEDLSYFLFCYAKYVDFEYSYVYCDYYLGWWDSEGNLGVENCHPRFPSSSSHFSWFSPLRGQKYLVISIPGLHNWNLIKSNPPLFETCFSSSQIFRSKSCFPLGSPQIPFRGIGKFHWKIWCNFWSKWWSFNLQNFGR